MPDEPTHRPNRNYRRKLVAFAKAAGISGKDLEAAKVHDKASDPAATMWQKMWSWAVVGAFALFLWGGGLTLMTSRLYFAATVCYVLGAALLILKFITWEEHGAKPLRKKMAHRVYGVLAVALATSVLVGFNYHLNGSSEDAPFIIQAKAGFYNFAPEENGTNFWVTYSSSGIKYRSPIPILAYVSLTNKQNIQSLIESISVRVKTENCDWFELLPIAPNAGKFSFAPTDWMHRAAVLDFQDNSLILLLHNHPIGAHDSVSGWMMFDTKAECQTAPGEMIAFKFSIKDAAGASADTFDSKAMTTGESNPTHETIDDPFLKVTGEKLDLIPFHEQRYFKRQGFVVVPLKKKEGDSE